MEPTIGNHAEESTLETSTEHILSGDYSGETDTHGDPLAPAPPRIGEQYQVTLPPFREEPFDWDCRLRLPIPISWVSNQICDNKGAQNGHSSKPSVYIAENSINHGSFSQDITVMDTKSDHGNCQEHTSRIDQMNVKLFQMHIIQGTGCIPLPSALSISWTDAESESFLLGLYIFGKKFSNIRRFVGSKKMGDILSYYYGKFYRSDAHLRWSECKKIKTKRSVHGQRLFIGWRQQEILNRLIPGISEASKQSLLEVTRIFSEGGITLQNYIFALKDIVGLRALVEAIGIGKGKCDLTGTALDPVKANQFHSILAEVPVGKAWSTLTTAEIIKILKGNYRLSKARSNDLFWEAVWPRLLARGWHSEQPKDQGFFTSKHLLIFLVPGVKKFSRRKLVKGDHYFDSVTDVLNKVASDPMLLEMNKEDVNGSTISMRDDCQLDKENKLDQDGQPDYQRHSYHPPPNCASDLMKFTVVDTSLVEGEAPFKVRELRSLPMDSRFSHIRASTSGKTESSSSKEQHDSSDISLNDVEDCHPHTSEDTKVENTKYRLSKRMKSDHVTASSRRKRPIDKNVGKKEHPSVLNKNPEKTIKRQFTRRRKPGKPDLLSSASEQSIFAACNYSRSDQISHSILRGDHFKMEESGMKTFDAMVALAAELCVPQGNASCNSFDKHSPNESGEGTVSGTALTDDKFQFRDLIDLNLPQIPPDFDATVSCTTGQAYMNVAATFQSETESLPIGFQGPDIGKQPVNSRRQSTRTRPLTTRALEALESGFLNAKRRARGIRSPNSDAPRPSRRARRNTEASASITMNHGNAISDLTDPKIEDAGDGHSGYANDIRMSGKSQFEMEGKGFVHDFLGIQ